MAIYKNQLKEKLEESMGCTLQHTGYPCNSCFHTILEDMVESKYEPIKLKEDVHEYWLAVLAFRGDYPDLPKRPDLIDELYNTI